MGSISEQVTLVRSAEALVDSRESFHLGRGTTSVKARDGEEGQRGSYGKENGQKNDTI